MTQKWPGTGFTIELPCGQQAYLGTLEEMRKREAAGIYGPDPCSEAEPVIANGHVVVPVESERPSSQEVNIMDFSTQALDGPPTCQPGNGLWSGMHCLHTLGTHETQCCGCGKRMSNPTANMTSGVPSFDYRLGAVHTEAGPFWLEVRAGMPLPRRERMQT